MSKTEEYLRGNGGEKPIISTDVAVIGLGPAGATAAVYARRAGLDAVVLEGGAPGGQVSSTGAIDNVPGFESIEGWELAMKLEAQVKRSGAKIVYKKVTNAILDEKTKLIVTDKLLITAKAVIICAGAKRRTLGLPNERKLTGRGVSYCAVCDGSFYKNKQVAVVGGGETAVSDAIYLSNLAEKVTIIHRRNAFRASKSKLEALAARGNIEVILNENVAELSETDNKLSSITLTSGKEIPVDGLFVAIGLEPDSTLFKGQIQTTENGYIVTDDKMRTSLKNVYAAGDIREKSLRQIVTAAADGATAAVTAADEIQETAQ